MNYTPNLKQSIVMQMEETVVPPLIFANHMCRPDYRKAASYYDAARDSFVQSDWIDANNNVLDYLPSTNIAPTEVMPVLISKNHEVDRNDLSERIIKPMMWGMIPQWHKGDYKSHGLTTNNCRIESILESRLYSRALKNGQRCIIGCQGFYEWQTTKAKGQPKQPYFIKASQVEQGQCAEESSNWVNINWNEKDGWTGPKLLMMAGLYDKWISAQGEEIYSFTIITMEANDTFKWLHHRMPAIIDNEELLHKWLDFSGIPGIAAVKLLQPVTSLKWHPVSTLVNNARNKDKKCNKPVDLNHPKAVNRIMDSWLKRSRQLSPPRENKKHKEDK